MAKQGLGVYRVLAWFALACASTPSIADCASDYAACALVCAFDRRQNPQACGSRCDSERSRCDAGDNKDPAEEPEASPPPPVRRPAPYAQPATQPSSGLVAKIFDIRLNTTNSTRIPVLGVGRSDEEARANAE